MGLKNLNPSKSGNYAAIDLLDDEPTRKVAFQLTPDQKNVLKGIYESFTQWCSRLNITPVDIRPIIEPRILPDPAI